MPSRSGSYRSAGVDIDAADSAKDRIAARVAATHGVSVLRGVGLFGGFFRAPKSDGNVVLVSSADSVGTKVLLAGLMGNHRGIGADLVNHCVNDILACGARPLFFLDYYATPKLIQSDLEQIIDGMTEACLAANCALIGGETAQLPGIYQANSYDLAGFIVGHVDDNRIIDGSRVREGDTIIGLRSAGLHTNGYTLARAALGLNGQSEEAAERFSRTPEWSDRSIGEILMTPHRSYLDDVAPLLDEDVIRGMAHITGGGIPGNLSRVIPEGLVASVDVRDWEPDQIFREIQQRGEVAGSEMYRVFNMGIGFVLIVDSKDAASVVRRVDGACVIGKIERATGEQRVVLSGLTDEEDV